MSDNCGFVLAGFRSLAILLNLFITGRRGKWDNNFKLEDLSNLLSSTCSGFLESYGQEFPNKKNLQKYNRRVAKVFSYYKKSGFFSNCKVILDSGGFQISIGRLTRKESVSLQQMYYEYLLEYHDTFDKAFILDVPPGPGCEIFHDFYDVYKLNLESYQKAQQFPQHIRDKIIYVHHFRTPKLWEIYTKIMKENDMFGSFQYHATGGIVANMASDMGIPCIIYVLPLIPLINEAKRIGRNYLNFHILGGATFRDIFFYELFIKHVKEKHNISLNITYDSSGPYKQLMTSRYLNAFDEHNNIKKLNIKSDSLHLRFINNYTVEDYCQKIIDDLAERWNFKKINVNGIYGNYLNRSNIPVETFHHDVKTYFLLYTLEMYERVQQFMKESVEIIYPLYKNGNNEEFNNACLDIIVKSNQGKMTKKQIVKTNSITRSLDMLSNLDDEYCKYVVDKFLSKDEFTDLDLKNKSLCM